MIRTSTTINNSPIKQEYCIKYLGILIDSNLNWKSHIGYIVKKIKRGIKVLSKLRYFTNIDILKKLYYALIEPFLVYGIIAWGNIYETILGPLLILQKRALCIMTFSKSDEHSSPIFKTLNLLKIHDLVSLNIAVFMYKYYYQHLPLVFQNFFERISTIHSYNMRLASKKSYYGIFYIRFLIFYITESLILGFKVPKYGIQMMRALKI